MNKVMVAAICRDEENHIQEWYRNVCGADRILLVDTGSGDRTVEIARSLASDHPDFNIIQMFPAGYEHAVPYDMARNLSFTGATEDTIVMWIDIDERFEGCDWVDVVRNVPIEANAVYVTMNSAGMTYQQMKGARGGSHVWRYGVHEVLEPIGSQVHHEVSEFETHHYQEYGKTYRSFHMQLLQSDFARYPGDQRVAFYLMRQHCYTIAEMIAEDQSIISNEEVVSYYENCVGPMLGRVTGINSQNDYATWAYIEVSRSIQGCSELAQEAVIHAMSAYCNRPDRPETIGQVAIAHYYNDENLACMGYALKCAETNVVDNRNFMFDASNMYREHVVDYLYYAAEALDLIDKAIFYANKYGRHDLVERGGQLLVGSPDTQSTKGAHSAAP